MADSPLQTSPQGLLEAFGLKTLGQQPDKFSDTCVPTVDVLPFYTSQRLATGTLATGAAGAITVTLQGVLQANQMIRGVCASMTIGAAAGTFLHVAVGVRTPLPSNAFFTLAFGTFVPRIGGTIRVQHVFGVPLIFPAGCVFEMQTLGDAAGVDHVPSLQSFLTSLV